MQWYRLNSTISKNVLLWTHFPLWAPNLLGYGQLTGYLWPTNEEQCTRAPCEKGSRAKCIDTLLPSRTRVRHVSSTISKIDLIHWGNSRNGTIKSEWVLVLLVYTALTRVYLKWLWEYGDSTLAWSIEVDCYSFHFLSLPWKREWLCCSIAILLTISVSFSESCWRVRGSNLKFSYVFWTKVGNLIINRVRKKIVVSSLIRRSWDNYQSTAEYISFTNTQYIYIMITAFTINNATRFNQKPQNNKNTSVIYDLSIVTIFKFDVVASLWSRYDISLAWANYTMDIVRQINSYSFHSIPIPIETTDTDTERHNAIRPKTNHRTQKGSPWPRRSSCADHRRRVRHWVSSFYSWLFNW